ncbi:MAG: cytochrome c [Vicinamibacterales bacterium]
MSITRLLTGAGLLVLAMLATAAAQAPRPKTVTTSSGVYTAAQAARGEQTYMSICVACHPAGTYSAAAFRAKWNGQLMSDLFSLVSSTMPKQEPGTLEAEEYAQMLAYILRQNGAPAGKELLPANVKALKRIRIDMPARAPAP